MKIKWAHTISISLATALTGLIISFVLIFNGFKASSSLPKTVPVHEITDQGKQTTIGALKFESGIKKEISSKAKGIDPGKISKKESLNIKELLFHYNPFLLIWGLTIVILAGFSAGAAPLAFDRIASIRDTFSIRKRVVAIMIGVVVLFGVIMLFTPALPSYLSYYTFWTPFADVIFKNHETMSYVVIVLLTLALPSLLGIAILFIAAQKLLNQIKEDSEKSKDTFLKKYGEIRSSLSFFLILLTLLITLSVLATGAFRKAILTAIRVEGLDIAPVEFVYLYGVFFTIFLALFYTPVYFQLLTLKQETVSNEHLKGFQQNEALQVSNWETIKVLASLLAPLVSSILPGILS